MSHNTVPITIRIKKEVLEEVKRIARERSFKKNDDFSYGDIIRECLDKVIESEKNRNF